MSAPLAKQPYSLLSSTNLAYGRAPVQTGRGVSIFQRVLNALNWVVSYPSRRSVVSELSRLSDRELNDIGLLRSDVRHLFSRPSL